MTLAILNKSWRQHPTRHQLYGHLPPIARTIQARRTRHAWHCWKSRDELISDVLLWTPIYARTYIQQLFEDTGCGPEDLPEAMNDREKWRERVRDIRAGGTKWWWWWWFFFNNNHLFTYSYIVSNILIKYEWFIHNFIVSSYFSYLIKSNIFYIQQYSITYYELYVLI